MATTMKENLENLPTLATRALEEASLCLDFAREAKEANDVKASIEALYWKEKNMLTLDKLLDELRQAAPEYEWAGKQNGAELTCEGRRDGYRQINVQVEVLKAEP